MRHVDLMAGLLAAFCLCTAVAAQVPATKPPPPKSADDEEIGLWLKQYVSRAPKWHVREYSPDGLVMTDRTVRENKEGHALGEIRIERTLEQETTGFAWRSARLTSDVDCLGSIVLSNQYRNGKVLKAAPRPQADATNTKITLYEGQNLTGSSRAFDVEPDALPAGGMGQALRDVCRLVMADTLDKGVATQGALLIGRDRQSLEAWAKTLPDMDAWEGLTFGPDALTMRTKGLKGGAKPNVRVRTEYYEPVLGASSARSVDANIQDPVTKRWIKPNARAIWIRSAVTEWEFDCTARTGRSFRTATYEMRGLKHETSDSRNPAAKVVAVQPRDTAYVHFQAVCAA